MANCIPPSSSVGFWRVPLKEKIIFCLFLIQFYLKKCQNLTREHDADIYVVNTPREMKRYSFEENVKYGKFLLKFLSFNS